MLELLKRKPKNVKQVCSGNARQRRSMRRRLHRLNIVERMNEGESFNDVVAATGIPDYTIANYLKSLGYKTGDFYRPRTARRRK